MFKRRPKGRSSETICLLNWPPRPAWRPYQIFDVPFQNRWHQKYLQITNNLFERRRRSCHPLTSQKPPPLCGSGESEFLALPNRRIDWQRRAAMVKCASHGLGKLGTAEREYLRDQPQVIVILEPRIADAEDSQRFELLRYDSFDRVGSQARRRIAKQCRILNLYRRRRYDVTKSDIDLNWNLWRKNK